MGSFWLCKLSNPAVVAAVQLAENDGVQSLGVGMKTGALLIFLWAGILATVLVSRVLFCRASVENPW